MAFDNVSNEPAGRDIDNEGPSHGLGAHETAEEVSFEQTVSGASGSCYFW